MCFFLEVHLFAFYIDWRAIVEREKFADAVLICTPDRLHKVRLVNVHMIEFFFLKSAWRA